MVIVLRRGQKFDLDKWEFKEALALSMFTINIQVLLEGELTLDRLTIMSEILINYLKSLTMGHLLWQHSKVSSCEEVLGGCLYCLFYWSSIQRLWIFLVVRTDVTLSLQRNT